MSFLLLNESDVKAVLTMDDLIETMTSALIAFSSGGVDQPVRSIISVAGGDAFFATMPAFVRVGVGSGLQKAPPGAQDVQTAPDPNPSRAALGAKLVTVFGGNTAKGLPSHLASILLMDPETGALVALLDGRYITEARTAAASAVSSRLLARTTASSLAIIGTGVQARSHLDALGRVHRLRQATVWSPNKERRDRFAAETSGAPCSVKAAEHAGEAVVGADLIVLATSSPTLVIDNGWVKPGAHVMAVGACRPNQREMDPALTARGRLFVDSREAALIEAGDVVMGIAERRFGPDHIVAEIGEVASGAPGRRSENDVTIYKSLGMAVEDVTAAALAYRRAIERGVGQRLTL